MGMFESIQYVSGGFTLLAFLAAVIASIIKHSISKQERMINSAPEENRAELIEQALEGFIVDTGPLTKAQKYDLLIKQMHHKSDRLTKILRYSLAAFIATAICFITLIVSDESNDEPLPMVNGLEITPDHSTLAVNWSTYLVPESIIKIYIRETTGSPDFRLFQEIPSSHGQVTISDLASSTSYKIRLVATLQNKTSSPADIEAYTDAHEYQLEDLDNFKAYYFGRFTDGLANDIDGKIIYLNHTGHWEYKGKIANGKPIGKGSLTQTQSSYSQYNPEPYELTFNEDNSISGNLKVDYTFELPDPLNQEITFRLQGSPTYEGYVKQAQRDADVFPQFNSFNLGPFLLVPHGEGKVVNDHDNYKSHVQGTFKHGRLNGNGEYWIARENKLIRDVRGEFIDGKLKNGTYFFIERTFDIHYFREVTNYITTASSSHSVNRFEYIDSLYPSRSGNLISGTWTNPRVGSGTYFNIDKKVDGNIMSVYPTGDETNAAEDSFGIQDNSYYINIGDWEMEAGSTSQTSSFHSGAEHTTGYLRNDTIDLSIEILKIDDHHAEFRLLYTDNPLGLTDYEIDGVKYHYQGRSVMPILLMKMMFGNNIKNLANGKSASLNGVRELIEIMLLRVYYREGHWPS